MSDDVRARAEAVDAVALLFAKRRQPAPTMDGAHQPNPAEIKAAQEAVEIVRAALAAEAADASASPVDATAVAPATAVEEAREREAFAKWVVDNDEIGFDSVVWDGGWDPLGVLKEPEFSKNSLRTEWAAWLARALLAAEAADEGSSRVEEARKAFYEAARAMMHAKRTEAAEADWDDALAAAVVKTTKAASRAYYDVLNAEAADEGHTLAAKESRSDDRPAKGQGGV